MILISANNSSDTIRENERSQVELLERDVYIQFNEIRRLRAENEELKKKNIQLGYEKSELNRQLKLYKQILMGE